MRCTLVKPYGVTDEILEIRGQQTVSFIFNEHEFKHSFYVCTLPTKAVGLIGMDFMGKPVPQSISKRARCHLPSSREGRSWLVLHTPGKQPLPSFHGVKRDTAPIPANRWHERKTNALDTALIAK